MPPVVSPTVAREEEDAQTSKRRLRNAISAVL